MGPPFLRPGKAQGLRATVRGCSSSSGREWKGTPPFAAGWPAAGPGGIPCDSLNSFEPVSM